MSLSGIILCPKYVILIQNITFFNFRKQLQTHCANANGGFQGMFKKVRKVMSTILMEKCMKPKNL